LLAWMIPVVLLLLLLILPVGGELRYDPGGFLVKLRAGPLAVPVFPSKKEKGKAREESEPPAEAKKKPGKKKLNGLKKDDILTLIRIGLKALNRLRLHFSIDLLELDWIAGGSDPFDAVLQYGRINGALGALQGPAHAVFQIREERIRTDLDLNATKPAITVRLIATIQIWEILSIAFCAGWAFLVWHFRRKKRSGADEASCTEGKGKGTWKTMESEIS